MSRVVLKKANIFKGDLILVNAEFGFKEPEGFDLVPVLGREDILLERRAAAALEKLVEKIGGRDDIVPVSGWRSQGEQQAIWDDTIINSGEEFTRRFVAVPGHSEHQTGLAIDLGLKMEHIDFICPEFTYDGICGEFRKLAPKYGFIERYPRGKEDITGIGHEPWHFRYVGAPHGGVMAETGLTLEEYTELLRGCVLGERCLKSAGGAEIAYLPAKRCEDTALEFEDDCRFSISGDNIGGFIITRWRGQDGNP